MMEVEAVTATGRVVHVAAGSEFDRCAGLLHYSDAVRPRDPTEFVGLLRAQGMLAFERGQALANLGVQHTARERIFSILGPELVGTHTAKEG
jgi:hypothetical protein